MLQNAQFPFSKIEMQYLFIGCKDLDAGTFNKIEENIEKLLNKRKISKAKNLPTTVRF